MSHPSLPFSPLLPLLPPPCGAELCDEHGQDEYFFGTKITQKNWWIHFCNLNHILYWGRSNFQAQKIMSTTRVSLVGDHCLYSHDLNVWFRGDIVRRNWMLVTLTGLIGVFSLTQSCSRNTRGFLSFWKKYPSRITIKRIVIVVINCLTDIELSSHLWCFLSWGILFCCFITSDHVWCKLQWCSCNIKFW